MTKIPLIVLFALCMLFSAGSALAQHVEFLDRNFNVVAHSSGASYSRSSVLQEDSSVYVEIHYLRGGLRMQGRYTNNTLQTEDGHFVYYFANGLKESEGYFTQGQKTGIWKRWDWEGHVKPDRVYPQFLASSESGPSIPAHFPGGIEALNQYVSAEIRYPYEAEVLGIEGWVYTAFTITSSGEVKDIEVIQTSHVSLNQEARRIIKCMPNWKPALSNGASVDSKFILPIVFDLSENDGTKSASTHIGTN